MRHEADACCDKEMSVPNMNSIQYKTIKLSRFMSGCHGNYACCDKEMSVPNMNSIQYKTIKLSRFMSGCHGN